MKTDEFIPNREILDEIIKQAESPTSTYPFITLEDKSYSAEQAITEIRNRTPVGKRIYLLYQQLTSV